ncbi:AraC family transcriptional regulator [Paenibacillus pasadenensis]|uniref:AraC family transcriptional regulator n=1 Tax=Paenibacillus TaxID=44249 RepID=UPI00042198E1|nr:helix-turn-helix domain-containing protein [Paenibacillus pasadenensis]
MSEAYWSRLQRTVDHIERCLDEPLTLSGLARYSGFSDYHFHRVFQEASGETVMDYVRKRRLSQAAEALVRSGSKIVDIAFAAGFNSHETFCRAFQRRYGLAPREFRRQGREAPPFPALDLHRLAERSGSRLCPEPRIEQRPGFLWIGEAVRLQSFEETEKAAGRRASEALSALLQQADGQAELVVYADLQAGSSAFTRLHGIEAQGPDAPPPGLVSRAFPPGLHAVFAVEAESPPQLRRAVRGVWEDAFGRWFPSSDWEHAGGPELERYLPSPGGPVPGGHRRAEVLVPVARSRR